MSRSYRRACLMTSNESRDLATACMWHGVGFIDIYYSLRLDYNISHTDAILLAGVPISGLRCSRLSAAGIPIRVATDFYNELRRSKYDTSEYRDRLSLFVDLIVSMGFSIDDARSYVSDLESASKHSRIKARNFITRRPADH